MCLVVLYGMKKLCIVIMQFERVRENVNELFEVKYYPHRKILGALLTLRRVPFTQNREMELLDAFEWKQLDDRARVPRIRVYDPQIAEYMLPTTIEHIPL